MTRTMTTHAYFLDAGDDSIPGFTFEMENSAVSLVMSAMGYDIIEIEETPIPVDDLIESVRQYINSDISSIIDTGRPELIQFGGHIEGVSLPEGIPFRFQEVESGYITDFVKFLGDLAHRAKEHGAISFSIPAN